MKQGQEVAVSADQAEWDALVNQGPSHKKKSLNKAN